MAGLAVAFADSAQAQFVVSNNNDSGAGSLRQAILDANAAGAPLGTPGATQSITFNAGWKRLSRRRRRDGRCRRQLGRPAG